MPVAVAVYSFDKSLRLLSAKDYKPVFDRADYKASTHELLMLSRSNQLSHPRLGLVIAKKHVRLAVQRNRVKRVIRESFRRHQTQLPSIDIVVLARPKLDHIDNGELHKICEKLWRKLARKAAQ